MANKTCNYNEFGRKGARTAQLTKAIPAYNPEVAYSGAFCAGIQTGIGSKQSFTSRTNVSGDHDFNR